MCRGRDEEELRDAVKSPKHIQEGLKTSSLVSALLGPPACMRFNIWQLE